MFAENGKKNGTMTVFIIVRGKNAWELYQGWWIKPELSLHYIEKKLSQEKAMVVMFLLLYPNSC